MQVSPEYLRELDNCMDMRGAIQKQNIGDVKKLLDEDFNPIANISYDTSYTKITPLVYALGLASINNYYGHDNSAIQPNNAKKIVQILQNHGAQKELSQNEASDFVKELNYLCCGEHLNDKKKNKIFLEMKNHLEEVNKVQEALKVLSPFFIFGRSNPQSNIRYLPKETVHLIAHTLYQALSKSFD